MFTELKHNCSYHVSYVKMTKAYVQKIVKILLCSQQFKTIIPSSNVHIQKAYSFGLCLGNELSHLYIST